MAQLNRKYLLAGIVPYVIWGTMSVPLRDLKAFLPEEILFYRVLVSCIIIWLTILIFKWKNLNADFKFFVELTKRNKFKFVSLTVISSILISCNWFTYMYAVNFVSLKSAAFAYLVCPLITAFCGFIFLKERLTKSKIIAMTVAIVSIVLLATGSVHEVVWSIIIASFYALYIVILKLIKEVDKFILLGLQLIISGLLMLPYHFLKSEPIPIEGLFWGHIFLIAILFTIIPLFLNAYALVGMPSSALGILIYLNPIVAFTVAFFYFDEKIDLAQVFAYCLLLVSIIIFNTSFLDRFFSKKHTQFG